MFHSVTITFWSWKKNELQCLKFLLVTPNNVVFTSFLSNEVISGIGILLSGLSLRFKSPVALFSTYPQSKLVTLWVNCINNRQFTRENYMEAFSAVTGVMGYSP